MTAPPLPGAGQIVAFMRIGTNSLRLLLSASPNCQLEFYSVQNQQRVSRQAFKHNLEIKPCFIKTPASEANSK